MLCDRVHLKYVFFQPASVSGWYFGNTNCMCCAQKSRTFILFCLPLREVFVLVNQNWKSLHKFLSSAQLFLCHPVRKYECRQKLAALHSQPVVKSNQCNTAGKPTGFRSMACVSGIFAKDREEVSRLASSSYCFYLCSLLVISLGSVRFQIVQSSVYRKNSPLISCVYRWSVLFVSAN